MEDPGKTLTAQTETNNKLNPYNLTPVLGFKPWPHWWEETTLTTAPSLLLKPGLLDQAS